MYRVEFAGESVEIADELAGPTVFDLYARRSGGVVGIDVAGGILWVSM